MQECPLWLVCGTQKGTAFELAEFFSYEASKKGLGTLLIDPSARSVLELPSQKRVIFFVSTTGQGDCPSNFKSWWNFLRRKDLPSSSLKNLKFTIFGLGDASYPRFNWMAKKLHKRLSYLGASCFTDIALSDEQHSLGHYGVLPIWMNAVFNCLVPSIPSIHSLSLSESSPYKFSFSWSPDFQQSKTQQTPFSCTDQFADMFSSPIENVERLTASDHFQQVYKVTFSLPNAFSYIPGDIVDIVTPNEQEDINTILRLFGWNDYAERTFKLKKNRSDAHYPSFINENSFCVTFRNFLSQYLQISHTSPNQRFFSFLAMYLKPFLSEILYEKLEELGNVFSSESIEAYQTYCWKPRRRLIEIIEEFLEHPATPTAEIKVPPEACLDLFNWIKPRSFSISSYMPNRFTITVGMIDFESNVLKTRRYGFFSSALHKYMIQNMQMPYIMKLTKGSMVLPNPLSGTLIFAGTGTGVAPLISFLQYLISTKDQLPESLKIVFIYGYRFYEKDFLHAQDFELARRILGDRFILIHGGSRDNKAKKLYIDDLILHNKETLLPLFKNDPWWFLCGHTKLPSRVKQVLIDLGINFSDLECQGRFQVETW